MRLDHSCVERFVVARLATAGAAGATYAEIEKELKSIIGSALPASKWRPVVEKAIISASAAGLIDANQNPRLVVTEKGLKETTSAFPGPNPQRLKWTEYRDTVLMAEALGLDGKSTKLRKSLTTAAGLRAAVIKAALLPDMEQTAPSASEIRNKLALKTLETKIDDPQFAKVSANSRIPEKMSLYLAAQHADKPKAIKTTNDLLAKLAAEQLGVTKTEINTLRNALLRKLLEEPAKSTTKEPAKKRQKPQAQTAKPETARPETAKPQAEKSAQSGGKSDLAKFIDAVRHSAKDHANGWQGNKRAYISDVWQGVQSNYPDLQIEEHQFKDLLVNAHKGGHITLQVADLRTRENIEHIKASATKYKNNEWHLIRVDD